MSLNKKETAAVAGAAALIGVTIFVAVIVLGIAISTLTVAVVWNWLGLHTVFGLSALGFWQTVAVGAGLNVLWSIFRGPVQVNTRS